MIARSSLRYLRMSPRKFRLIIPLVKGKNAEAAMQILMSVKKNAAFHAAQLLKSALANAKRIQGMDLSRLYISRLIVNCGPSLKRYRAASMGRASAIKKRTSHIILELDEMKTPKAKTEVKDKEKPVKAAKIKSKIPNTKTKGK